MPGKTVLARQPSKSNVVVGSGHTAVCPCHYKKRVLRCCSIPLLPAGPPTFYDRRPQSVLRQPGPRYSLLAEYCSYGWQKAGPRNILFCGQPFVLWLCRRSLSFFLLSSCFSLSFCSFNILLKSLLYYTNLRICYASIAHLQQTLGTLLVTQPLCRPNKAPDSRPPPKLDPLQQRQSTTATDDP